MMKDRDILIYDSVSEFQSMFVDILNSIPRDAIEVNHFRRGKNFHIPIKQQTQSETRRMEPIFYVNWREFNKKGVDYDTREPRKFLTVACT